MKTTFSEDDLKPGEKRDNVRALPQYIPASFQKYIFAAEAIVLWDWRVMKRRDQLAKVRLKYSGHLSQRSQ